MKFKYKVEIVIDEEKVINDDIYDPKEMYEFIRNMFKRFDLAEIKTDKPYHLIFADKGRNRVFGTIMLMKALKMFLSNLGIKLEVILNEEST